MIVEGNTRTLGKSCKQFSQFVGWCKAGKRIHLIGPNYVAVDRATWDEIQAKLHTPYGVVDEASSLPEDFVLPPPPTKGTD